MSVSRLVRRSSWVLCAVLVSSALAQGQTAQQSPPQKYEPQVGQAGKDVVWVPTSDALVARMLDIAKVTAKDHVIDLGSGDGRTVIAAAKRGARAHGIEYNPEMVALAKQKAVEAGVADRATFETADLFESDFSKASVITMFLLPSINMKLRPKLLDLAPGTRVVSNTFTMEDWSADETATVEEDCSSWCTALLWIVPAKVAGTWQLPQGQLALTQTFQMVTGTMKSGSNSGTITEGRLRGADLSFTLSGTRYTARVNGNSMEGTATTGTAKRAFKATKMVS